jgi:hypothetical protein
MSSNVPPTSRDQVLYGRAAAIGLAIILVGFGLANLSCTFVFESIPQPSVLSILVVGVMFGLVPAQAGLLTLWLVWAPFPFWLRHLLHWNAAGGLMLAGMVGAEVAMEPSAGDGRWFTDMLIAVFILPAISLACQLPHWPLRIYAGWRVARPVPIAAGDSPPRREPLGIGHMLAGTLVVAVSIAGLRAALTLDQQRTGQSMESNFWIVWCWMVAILSLASTLSLLPALILMLRPKSTGQACLLWLAYVLVPCCGLAIACYLATASNDPLGLAGPLTGAIATACVTFATALGFPLLVVRLAGWRLVFPGDRRAAPNELEQLRSGWRADRLIDQGAACHATRRRKAARTGTCP